MSDEPAIAASMETFESSPDAPTALDRLRSIYAHGGPYTSVYLQTLPLLPDPDGELEQRWHQLRVELTDLGAPSRALDAVGARLALPGPEDTAGVCVIAAADGHTIVDHSLDPPRTDFTLVDVLPYVAPLLEWEQRRIPHIVVTVDDTGADIVLFGSDHRSGIVAGQPVDKIHELAADIASRVDTIGARLVVLAGDASLCRALDGGLTGLVDASCRVVVEGSMPAEELAEATVRHVTDIAAQTTVGYLREFRFLASHESAVDGTEATIDALNDGRLDVLLIHDDPSDERVVEIDEDGTMRLADPSHSVGTRARFVDAALRAAIEGDIVVHIIPSTGPDGPADDVAGLMRGVAPGADDAGFA